MMKKNDKNDEKNVKDFDKDVENKVDKTPVTGGSIKVKEEKKPEILDIDDFEDDITLYNLISPGKGKSLMQLRDIADAYNNIKPSGKTPFSVLITGAQSKMTHALALARGLGYYDIFESPWRLLDRHLGVGDFLRKSSGGAAIITDLTATCLGCERDEIYGMMTKGEVDSWNDSFTQRTMEVKCPVIITAQRENAVPPYLMDKFTHRVKISEEYMDVQVADIIERRLKYCNIEYNKSIPAGFAKVFKNDLRRIILVLKASVTVMKAQRDSKLMEKHVKRAIMYI